MRYFFPGLIRLPFYMTVSWLAAGAYGMWGSIGASLAMLCIDIYSGQQSFQFWERKYGELESSIDNLLARSRETT